MANQMKDEGSHQTTVERRSWLLFLRGARTGSPRRRFPRMAPAKMTSMVEDHRARGCFLENGREPGERECEGLRGRWRGGRRELFRASFQAYSHHWRGRP